MGTVRNTGTESATSTRRDPRAISGERRSDRSTPRSGRLFRAGSGTSIPTELLEEAARRLGLLAGALALATALGLFLPYALPSVPIGSTWVRTFVHLPFVVGSAALAIAALRRRLPTAWVLDVALAYQIFASVAIAIMINGRDWPAEIGLPGWSPVAVLTLIAPIVVPTTAPRALVCAVLGALADPLALLLHVQLGVIAMPSAAVMLFRFLPNIVVVPAAVLIARLVHRLGERLARATELGSYRLIERIGAGGMGEVWRASHRLLARDAAVKLIRPELLSEVGAGDTMRARFEREARAIASLRSPNTIQLYDYGIASDGTLFFVMELLDGVDLESLVRAEGPLSPARVVHLGRQICRSLREAHAAGLVHRDVKPANLFVCGEGDHLKVLDFGLVRDRGEGTSVTLTGADAVIGTPAYLPPEVALGGKVDARTDLYAVGCVLYFMLTGSLVFEASQPIEMAVAHATRAPERPSVRSGREIPEALEAVVMRCLEKDPELRPASADELDALLRAAL